MLKLQKKIQFTALFYFFLLPPLLFSKEIKTEPKPDNPLNFRFFKSQDGLYANKIRQIIQDELGFIWIASNEGLIKFDGYEFQSLGQPDNNHSLLNTDITCLFLHQSGDLWIGTAKGLLRYHRKTGRFIEITFLGKKQLYVTSIAEDKTGRIWVGTDQGLFLVRESQALHVFPEKSAYNVFGFVIAGKENDLWLATNNSLYKINSQIRLIEDSVRYSEDNVNTDNIPTSICFDKDENIWLGKYDGNAYCYNQDKKILKMFDLKQITSNESAIINDIYHDAEGNLWFAIDESGAYRFENGNFEPYVNPQLTGDRLPCYKLTTIYIDREKNTWLALEKNGLALTNSLLSLFKKIELKNSNGSQIVSSVLQDHKGQVWLGTDGGGLYLYDAAYKLKHHFTNQKFQANSISNDAILCLFEDSKKRIWAGTFRGGLNLYNQSVNGFKHYVNEPGNKNSLSKNDVRQIAEDKEGNLWLSIHGKGVTFFNPEKETFVNYTDFVSGWTYDLIVDSEGTIWVTTNRGISKKKKSEKQFSHFLLENPLSDNQINCIFEDKNGDIWIGTNHELFKSNKEFTFLKKTKIPYLQSSAIMSIQQNKSGILFIGTNRGLITYHPESGICQKFGIKDGIPSEDFILNSGYMSPLDRLFLGTNSGLCIFESNKFVINELDPKPFVSDVKVFDKSIIPALNKALPYIDDLKFAYNQNHLIFELECPTYYHGADGIQLQYIMEGLEKDWQNATKSRRAVYSSLPPGEYILKIRVLKNGIKAINGKSIHIAVTPPFWQSLWFRIISLVSIVMLVYFYFSLKTRNIKKANKLLEEKVIQRTQEISHKNEILQEQRTQLELANNSKDKLFSVIAHDLRSPFAGILSLVDLLDAGQNKLDEYQKNEILMHLKKASRNAFDILEKLLQWAGTQTGRKQYRPYKKIAPNISELACSGEQDRTAVRRLTDMILRSFLYNLSDKLSSSGSF